MLQDDRQGYTVQLVERYADSQDEKVSNKNPIAITGIGVKIDARFLWCVRYVASGVYGRLSFKNTVRASRDFNFITNLFLRSAVSISFAEISP